MGSLLKIVVDDLESTSRFLMAAIRITLRGSGLQVADDDLQRGRLHGLSQLAHDSKPVRQLLLVQLG